MTFIKHFLAEAKKDSKLWTELSKNMAFSMFFYGIVTYLLYRYTGSKYIGGEDMNIPVLIIMFFIAALLTNIYRMNKQIELAQKKS